VPEHLHIVSLAIPYPVIHGGLFDLYYKLVALHKAGIKIHLHCFGSRDKQQPELNKYCETVNYYSRNKRFSFSIPYIVFSRRSNILLNKLLQDDHPILLEGIHCTYILNDERFNERKILLRLHNVEYLYYQNLFKSSASFLKKIYYLYESYLLKKYERKIACKPSAIFAVSEEDKNFYLRNFGVSNIEFLPVFVKESEPDIPGGTGCFCLYHGNLSVPENELAVKWLMEKIFIDASIPLVIAGKDPSARLVNRLKRMPAATLIINPSTTQLDDLIKKAQCNVLPSFNSTGIKLKLVNTLFPGRHCIVNTAGVSGSGLEELCTIADTENAFRLAVKQLFRQPVQPDTISLRKKILSQVFNNSRNAETIIRKL
jgi:hypothetical protein